MRGEPQSRLLIGVALFFRFSGWLCLTWLPLGMALGLSGLLKSQENEDIPTMVGYAVGLFVGVLFDAVVWWLLARGITSGNRVAYIVVALGLFGGFSLATLVALSSLFVSVPLTTTVMCASYALLFGIGAVVIGIISFKEKSTHG